MVDSGVNCLKHSTAQACGSVCLSTTACRAFTFLKFHVPCSCILYETDVLSEPVDDGNATAYSYIKSKCLYSNIYHCPVIIPENVLRRI